MNHRLSKEEKARMHRDTEAGIETARAGSDDQWRAMALECLRVTCLSKVTFTVNDVRELVNRSPLTTHDNRAMGGVIKTGERSGWMEATGESIPSVVGHKVHIQIWKSLIYKAGSDRPAQIEEPKYRYEVIQEGVCKVFSVTASRVEEFLNLYPDAMHIHEKLVAPETKRERNLKHAKKMVDAFDGGKDPFAV